MHMLTKQCFSGKTKHTCQNSAIFKHFQNWPKSLGGTFLPVIDNDLQHAYTL